MYRIGEFSYLCETTIKTLRHYDKIDLLKPTSVDKFTGYRYYEEKQIEILRKIKNLQNAGFSLSEIKDLLNENNQEKLRQQIEKIKEENSKKIMILQEMTKNMSNQKVELITNPNYIVVGITTTIKSRMEINNVLEKIDSIINEESFTKYDMFFENFEKGYQEEDIKCFIGRVLPKHILENTTSILFYKKDGVEIHNSQMVKTTLHTTTKNVLEGYKDIIEYANKNNIQIRGNFQEVYNNDKIDIYVESYDLSIENEDVIRINKNKQDKIKNIYPKELIGTWLLMGEITEPPYLFNPKEKHYMPDTILITLELNKDGTTNFEHITWKERYLIIKENNITYYSYLMPPKKYENEVYMKTLINQKESNSRPYEYYYKKIK